MEKTVFKSNGATVADGVRVTEVVDGRLFVLVDPKEKRYSEVTVKIIDDPAPVDPDPVPEPDPDPTPDPDPVEPDPEPPTIGEDLPALVASAKPGDVIDFEGKDAGYLVLYGHAFAEPITITNARIGMLTVNHCEGIKFENNILDYVYAGEPEHEIIFYVNDSKRITFENNSIEGDDGPAKVGNGWGLTFIGCDDIEVTGNTIKTFLRCLKVLVCNDVLIHNNDISDFSGDGVNFALVNDVEFVSNHIHDARSALGAEFHKDMLQFWTQGDNSPSTNITIRGNLIDIGDGGWTQSIFMRNERVDKGEAGIEMYYQNIAIEDNVIKNAHTHGITVGECNGLRIVGNRLERKLNVSNPSNAGWEAQGRVTFPAIFATSDYLGEVVIQNNTAPRIEIGNPAWDGGGNTVTGTGA